ncbi:MAG: hypothetical protein AAF702_05650 [Chloroflexota bacterium]
MRSNRNDSILSDTFSLSGWIYADLLLALMVIFLAAVSGSNPLDLLSRQPADPELMATETSQALALLPTDTPTPDVAATDVANNEILATSVGGTIEAIATLTGEPTSTPFPTPTSTNDVGATQTALAHQIVAALVATQTAAPTATGTNTPIPTVTASATTNVRATQTAFARSLITSVAATLTAQPTWTTTPTPTITRTPTPGPTPTPSSTATPAPTANVSATETAIARLVLRAISATQTAEPTDTPLPTNTVDTTPTSQPTPDERSTQTAIAEGVATRLVATLTAIAAGTSTPVPTLVSGLSREPLDITIVTNADALLAQNPTEVQRLRGEIQALFGQYRGVRQAGIVLTFGTSPDPNEGNALSSVLNRLLAEELPSVFGNSVLNDYHIISGNINARGNVQVQVYLVAEG